MSGRSITQSRLRCAIMTACDTLAEQALARLKQTGQTLCTAESCTGGLLGKLLTDIPGSSQSYLGGVISYTNGVKATLLQVDRTLLDTAGPVSEPVAKQMAQGIQAALGGSFGLSITGLAGPDSDESGRPVGLVYIGLAGAGVPMCQELHLQGSRAAIREQACEAALALLLQVLRQYQ